MSIDDGSLDRRKLPYQFKYKELRASWEEHALSMLCHKLGNDLAERFMDMALFNNCLNCRHWIHEPEGCTLANGARPPAKIIVVGCELHSDEIPF